MVLTLQMYSLGEPVAGRNAKGSKGNLLLDGKEYPVAIYRFYYRDEGKFNSMPSLVDEKRSQHDQQLPSDICTSYQQLLLLRHLAPYLQPKTPTSKLA